MSELVQAFENWKISIEEPSNSRAFQRFTDNAFAALCIGSEQHKRKANINSKAQGEAFLAFYKCLQQESRRTQNNTLGDMYITMGLEKKEMKQHYSPKALGTIMGGIIATQHKANNPVEVLIMADPTGCGSGRLLFTGAAAMRAERPHIICYGADLDITACYMAAIGAAMLQQPASIRCGDILEKFGKPRAVFVIAAAANKSDYALGDFMRILVYNDKEREAFGILEKQSSIKELLGAIYADHLDNLSAQGAGANC